MSLRSTPNKLDLQSWAEFDASALTIEKRAVYLSRRRAIEMYCQHAAIADIEVQTGVYRSQLYRLINRCVRTHEDGRIFGFRALVPYSRVTKYDRVAQLRIFPLGGSRGTAGAFQTLLQSHPTLIEWIDQQIRHKRVSLLQISTDDGLRTRLNGLKSLHFNFLRECRTLHVQANDYPFNTERMGIRSLASYTHDQCLQTFARTAHLAGATHLKGLPKDMQASAPPARQILEVVEFDGHRLDVRLKVVVKDPLGFEQEFEIERIWLLVIIDVCTRAVLGYHVSLNREYSRYDVIRTIESALEPHREHVFTLPGVGYGGLGGFPSTKIPELGFATWQWFKLDNAKANLSDDVRHALADFIGCFIDAGPAHTPDDRPYIERFFGSIASSLSSRLPGYTGSNARDLRRALADPKGNLRLYVSLDELEELLEAALATYNSTPHNGLNGRTPLEAVEHSLHACGAMLNWLPASKRKTLCLMHTPRLATVRGYIHQGQRPHINFHGVRYTNALLASTAVFLGQELRLYYNSEDLRTVRAFSDDGAEIGVLKAQGAWGEIVHDLKLRQEIIRQRGSKRLSSTLTQEFLSQYIEQKFVKAKGTRRGASELAQTLRTLAAAPTSLSQADHASRTPSSPDATEPPPSPTPRIEPQRLSIGTGYVGTL